MKPKYKENLDSIYQISAHAFVHMSNATKYGLFERGYPSKNVFIFEWSHYTRVISYLEY